MSLAMGAAVTPPVPAWSESATATATLGASAGAKAMNQVLLRPETPVSAVPVLPATDTPEIWAAVPVPDSTTSVIMAVSSAAVDGSIAVFHSSGLEPLDDVAVGRR